MLEPLERLYREDPDAGIHSAAEWTLRRLKREESLGRPKRERCHSRSADSGDGTPRAKGARLP